MRRLLPLAILAALLTAGCNRGETVRMPRRAVVLRTDDYRIAPQRVRVRPGRVTLTLRNTGVGPHDLVLQRRGRTRARVPTVLPGEHRTVTVRLHRGTYRMTCSLPHHDVLGEYGTLSVR